MSDELRTLLLSKGSNKTVCYSLSYIPRFEQYIDDMCSGSTEYVFDGVRILIKLYLLFPQSRQAEKITQCLMLAFLHSDTDLLALLYMLPTLKINNNNKIDGEDLDEHTKCQQQIVECNTQLTNCHFEPFWTAWATLSSNSVVGALCTKYKTHMQQRILHMLALSYRTAPKSLVTAAIQSETVPKDSLIEKIETDTVVFVATADNTKRQRVYQEGVTFANVSQLISKMAQ